MSPKQMPKLVKSPASCLRKRFLDFNFLAAAAFFLTSTTVGATVTPPSASSVSTPWSSNSLSPFSSSLSPQVVLSKSPIFGVSGPTRIRMKPVLFNVKN